MQRSFRKIHRWLGLIFSVFVFIAAGSGLIHNLMTMTQSAPPPALPRAQLELREGLLDPAAALSVLEQSSSPTMVSLRPIGGETWYQFAFHGQAPTYVNASTGEIGTGIDERYASEIATTYLGGQEVTKTDYLTNFNREYIGIFRILPVYRLDAEDGKGTRLYVSTTTGSVTRHTDNRRQLQADIFSIFHKFAFIRDPFIRSVALTTTTTGIALVALTGIILFWRLPRKRKDD